MIETVISLLIIVIGLAGIFTANAQTYALLRRSKEIVAAREDILSRLDAIRTLSYSQVSKTNYLKSTTLVTGAAGDCSPFGATTAGMQNFTETVTVYALGWHLFSDDNSRANATPDFQGEFASQLDTIAPNAPKTYKANSATKGDWTQQIANALPYIKIIRTGTGASAVTTVAVSGNGGDLSSYPQLRVDVMYSWTDSNNVSRSAVASTIVSQSGGLL